MNHLIYRIFIYKWGIGFDDRIHGQNFFFNYQNPKCTWNLELLADKRLNDWMTLLVKQKSSWWPGPRGRNPGERQPSWQRKRKNCHDDITTRRRRQTGLSSSSSSCVLERQPRNYHDSTDEAKRSGILCCEQYRLLHTSRNQYTWCESKIEWIGKKLIIGLLIWSLRQTHARKEEWT